jgi:hypothetical protein
MLQEWSVYVNAGVPVTWLSTHEEARAEAALASVTRSMKIRVLRTVGDDGETQERIVGADTPTPDGGTVEVRKGHCAIWSLTSGERAGPGWEQPQGWPVDRPLPGDWASDGRLAASPHGALLQAIEWCETHRNTPVVMIVRDAHGFTQSPQWRRAVKDSTRRLRATQARMVLLSYQSELPPDMTQDVPVLLPGLPTREALELQCRDTLAGLDVDAGPEACADALRGLGLREAKDAMLIDYSRNLDVDPKRLADHKTSELAKVGGVAFKGQAEGIDEVGGMEVMVEDLADFQGSLTQAALDFGCDPPKGFMVVGVAGGGKSLFGRAASNALGLPLVELSPSECEDSHVGGTGNRIRAALRTVDAVSPCVVLIDEGEKAFGSGGEKDSGSKETLRLEFLRWAQNRRGRVMVIMTCNDASKLPPEMKRKGRWDETYFVDIPHPVERHAIIKVHLKKRGRMFENGNLDSLVEASEGFTGAEIESGIAKAIRRCFKEGQRDLNPEDVLTQFESTTPQSQGAQIKAMRQQAKEVNAKLASRPAPRSRTRKGRKGTGTEPGKPTRLVESN